MHRSIHYNFTRAHIVIYKTEEKKREQNLKFCTHTCTGIGDIVFNCLNLQERIYIIQPHCH